MLERPHDEFRLAWPQAVVYENDSENRKDVSFDRLGDRLSRLLSCYVLVCEVNDRVVGFFDQQICLGQTILLFAGLQVGESGVFVLVHVRVEVFEFTFALVEVPELLLGTATHKESLCLKVLLLLLLVVDPHLFRVGNGAHIG